MDDYKLSLDEQETIINMNAADEMVNIWSCQKHIIAMLKKQKHVKLIKETKYGCEFELPVSEFNLTAAVRPKRQQSEANRQASAERARIRNLTDNPKHR